MKKFKFDGSFGDLGQFGIYCLTGESCAYGTRLLCDLTEQGVKVIEAAFGMPHRTENKKRWDGSEHDVHPSFANSWNGGSKENPHVASIHLGRGMAKDIAIIGMFEAHECNTVLVFEGGYGSPSIIGVKLEDGEEFSVIQEYVAKYAGQYSYDDATGQVSTIKEPVAGYQRSITPINQPRRGGFCVHAMTGRSM